MHTTPAASYSLSRKRLRLTSYPPAICIDSTNHCEKSSPRFDEVSGGIQLISSISSNSAVQTISTDVPKAQPAATTTKPTEDTVHLSPQAVAAAAGGSKDVDHDGDSQ